MLNLLKKLLKQVVLLRLIMPIACRHVFGAGCCGNRAAVNIAKAVAMPVQPVRLGLATEC